MMSLFIKRRKRGNSGRPSQNIIEWADQLTCGVILVDSLQHRGDVEEALEKVKARLEFGRLPLYPGLRWRGGKKPVGEELLTSGAVESCCMRICNDFVLGMEAVICSGFAENPHETYSLLTKYGVTPSQLASSPHLECRYLATEMCVYDGTVLSSQDSMLHCFPSLPKDKRHSWTGIAARLLCVTDLSDDSFIGDEFIEALVLFTEYWHRPSQKSILMSLASGCSSLSYVAHMPEVLYLLSFLSSRLSLDQQSRLVVVISRMFAGTLNIPSLYLSLSPVPQVRALALSQNHIAPPFLSYVVAIHLSKTLEIPKPGLQEPVPEPLAQYVADWD
eukprot:TRINITY_DN10843_c0_g1_i1.p1 TRINITY_DN10843_c0_g1~~TRINITY_DN10843_c0_g1_i1.p1  ORF type:complete len:347 (+),score=36.42 TRINITY_DN10843_c0_g1_i1:48-1043(+)